MEERNKESKRNRNRNELKRIERTKHHNNNKYPKKIEKKNSTINILIHMIYRNFINFKCLLLLILLK